MTSNFSELKEKLNVSEKELLMKAVKKLGNMLEFEMKKPMLKWDFAGVRRIKFGDRIRIIYRVCKECRVCGFDSKFPNRCGGCERKDDLVKLVDFDLHRGDNTYENARKLDKPEFNDSFKDAGLD